MIIFTKESTLRIFIPLLLLLLAGCGSAPITGRKQILMIPDQNVLALSFNQYREFIANAPISSDKIQTERVRRIGKRIAKATEEYLLASGLDEERKKFQWEFNLVRDSRVNAWCMPGGKIVVFEGILPVASDDDELATVMAHEVAHAIAKHANERLSHNLFIQAGGNILSLFLKNQGYWIKKYGPLLYNVSSQVFFQLPFSRDHEYEADKIGLYLMAMAGYNYLKAESFWQRMSEMTGSSIDFLSTHPSNEKRIKAIKEELPKVSSFLNEKNNNKVLPTPAPVGHSSRL